MARYKWKYSSTTKHPRTLWAGLTPQERKETGLTKKGYIDHLTQSDKKLFNVWEMVKKENLKRLKRK